MESSKIRNDRDAVFSPVNYRPPHVDHSLLFLQLLCKMLDPITMPDEMGALGAMPLIGLLVLPL